MGCDTYTVRIGSVKLAQHMTLDTAILLAGAMFNKWNNEKNLAITIEREDNEPCSGEDIEGH